MLVVMGLDTDIVGFTFTHMDPYFLMSGNGVLIHTKPQRTAMWMEFILEDMMIVSIQRSTYRFHCLENLMENSDIEFQCTCCQGLGNLEWRNWE